MDAGEVITALLALAWADGFDRGVGPRWAIRQEVRGRVSTAPAPGRRGLALVARAGPKAGGVAKAALVARPAPIGVGRTLRVAFDLYAPPGTPLDSIQLLDLECATCGEAGNPGIRLYLRRGRLRIDRSKIGIRHAWTRDDAPALSTGRWHRIVATVRVDAGDDGAARVTLDGREVLAARGATVMPLARRWIDRVQLGVTANSNAVPVTLLFDEVRVAVD